MGREARLPASAHDPGLLLVPRHARAGRQRDNSESRRVLAGGTTAVRNLVRQGGRFVAMGQAGGMGWSVAPAGGEGERAQRAISDDRIRQEDVASEDGPRWDGRY